MNICRLTRVNYCKKYQQPRHTQLSAGFGEWIPVSLDHFRRVERTTKPRQLHHIAVAISTHTCSCPTVPRVLHLCTCAHMIHLWGKKKRDHVLHISCGSTSHVGSGDSREDEIIYLRLRHRLMFWCRVHSADATFDDKHTAPTQHPPPSAHTSSLR